MEYDNDRIVKGTYKAEVFCWLIFTLINPVVYSLGLFPHQKSIWIVLLVVNLLLLPLYILYSRVVVPKFLFPGKWLVYGALTVLFSLLVQTLLFLMYNIVRSGLFSLFIHQHCTGKCLDHYPYLPGGFNRLPEKKTG